MEGSSFVNINLTFILQIISFLIFFLGIYKKFWPQLLDSLDQRSDQIAQGLENADRASKTLEKAQSERKKILHETSVQTDELLKEAKSAAKKIIQSAAVDAEEKCSAKREEFVIHLEQLTQKARLDLEKEVGNLAIEIAQKLLEKQQYDEQSLEKDELQTLLKKVQNESN